MNDKQFVPLIKRINAKEWNKTFTFKFNYWSEDLRIKAVNPHNQKESIGFCIPIPDYIIAYDEDFRSTKTEESLIHLWGLNFLNNKNVFKKIEKTALDIVRSNNKFINYLQKAKPRSFSNKQLEKLLAVFSNRYMQTWVHCWIRPDIFLEKELQIRIQKELKVSHKKAQKILQIISIPANIGSLYYKEEPIKLIQLALKIQKNKIEMGNLTPDIDDIDKDIENHIYNFGWLNNTYSDKEQSFTKKDIIQRLNLLLRKNLTNEIRLLKKADRDQAVKSKNTLSRCKFSSDIKTLVEALQSAVFLRTYNNENSDRLFYYGRRNILFEISKRFNIPKDKICLLSSDEIIQILHKKKINLKEIFSKRSATYAFLILNGKTYMLSGKPAKLIRDAVIEKYDNTLKYQKYKGGFKLKGTIASRGLAQGTARIVLSLKDLSKVNKGDVLIATMTRPDFVIAMEKASAFVTDEGGLTCHAAIIAREFGVPCITGTKIATKIIPDGKIINVDANKGVITSV